MGSCLKKILPSTPRSLDPIKTNYWPGKLPRKTQTNLTQMGSLRESCRADMNGLWLWIPGKCIASPVSFSSCSVRLNLHGDFVYVDSESTECPIFLQVHLRALQRIRIPFEAAPLALHSFHLLLGENWSGWCIQYLFKNLHKHRIDYE